MNGTLTLMIAILSLVVSFSALAINAWLYHRMSQSQIDDNIMNATNSILLLLEKAKKLEPRERVLLANWINDWEYVDVPNFIKKRRLMKLTTQQAAQATGSDLASSGAIGHLQGGMEKGSLIFISNSGEVIGRFKDERLIHPSAVKIVDHKSEVFAKGDAIVTDKGVLTEGSLRNWVARSGEIKLNEHHHSGWVRLHNRFWRVNRSTSLMRR